MYDAVIIIQARMESSRLPGKVLKLIQGVPLVQFLVTRLKSISCKKSLVVAIPDLSSSDPLHDVLSKEGIHVVRGESEKVYSRFIQVLDTIEPVSWIVRVTADNPLTDISSIKRGLDLLKGSNFDYAWHQGIPVGMGVDFFSYSSFIQFKNEPRSSQEEEHIVPLYRGKPQFKGLAIEVDFPKGSQELSFTVDTDLDYMHVSSLVDSYNIETDNISLKEMVTTELLKKGYTYENR